MQRHVEVLRTGGIDAKKLGRRRAHDGEQSIVNQDRLANRRRDLSKAALRIPKAGNRDRRRARAIVARVYQTGGRRRHS
jgi:hypothetical protein